MGRLVLPQCFTRQEIELLAEPLSTDGSNARKVETWMQRTGGIDGRPLRLHADHLRPVERVIRAFLEEVKGVEPVTRPDKRRSPHAPRCASSTWALTTVAPISAASAEIAPKSSS